MCPSKPRTWMHNEQFTTLPNLHASSILCITQHLTRCYGGVLRCVIGPLTWHRVRKLAQHCMCVLLMTWNHLHLLYMLGSVQHVALCAVSEKCMGASAKSLRRPLFLQRTLLRLCAHRRQWTACTVSYHICKPPDQTCSSWQRYTLIVIPPCDQALYQSL